MEEADFVGGVAIVGDEVAVDIGDRSDCRVAGLDVSCSIGL